MIRGMEALLARARREQAEWESLRSKVREALPGLVDVLVREYGVRRVTLFGSLHGPTPSRRPDIDLLVEGLDASRRAEAQGRLFLLAPLPVDLVPREIGRPENDAEQDQDLPFFREPGQQGGQGGCASRWAVSNRALAGRGRHGGLAKASRVQTEMSAAAPRSHSRLWACGAGRYADSSEWGTTTMIAASPLHGSAIQLQIHECSDMLAPWSPAA